MDCGTLYKRFWEKRDPGSYARISPEQLAGISRMALRAYDTCQAGDEHCQHQRPCQLAALRP